jgi:DNA-binding MarR family transcriptional regulator
MPSDLPCACTALRKASRAITRLYDERLSDSGMTISQFAILRNLAREGSLPLSRLADLLVMERTSLYRTLAPIERHGWIAIEPGRSARTKIVSLTTAGREALFAATGPWERAQGEIVAAVGLPDFQALEGHLRKLVSAIGEEAR